jgi:hypothetical protein
MNDIYTTTNTYGPISDLEKHLPTDWWATLFNAIYLKTDGDVVECLSPELGLPSRPSMASTSPR